jgi:hypothetical protein
MELVKLLTQQLPVTQQDLFYKVSEDWLLSAPPTHAKHAARIREEVAPPVEAVVAVEMAVQATMEAVEAAVAVAVPPLTKTSTLTMVVVAAAAVAVAVLATVLVAMVKATVSITAEKDQNAVVQTSQDARTVSSSAQTLVAAAAD